MSQKTSQPSQLPPTPPTTSAAPASDLTTADVTKIVREEIDRGNKLLEFVQGQIDKDRSFFKHLMWVTTGFLGLIAASVGWVSFSSLEQMKSNLRDSVRAELDISKAEIAATKANAIAAAAEARAAIRIELDSVRAEVQKRVEKEFDSDNIKRVVADVAAQSTKGELNATIRVEAANQVAAGLKKESEEIKRIVKDTTAQAVLDMHPLIESTVTKETSHQVGEVIGPLQNQLAETIALQTVHRAATESIYPTNNLRPVEFLWKVAHDFVPESKYIQAKKVAEQVLTQFDIEIARANEMLRKQTYESVDLERRARLRSGLFSSDFTTRMEAIQMFPLDDPSFVELYIQVLKNETSLGLALTGTIKLNILTGCSFNVFRLVELEDWDRRGRLACKR